MERFRPALRRVAAELDLPRQARTELLLELAADLESLYEHHRTRGLPEDEAATRAEAAVLGSSEVIRRLGRLHVSPWRGWGEEVSGRLRGLDLIVLSVGVLPVLATAVGVLVPALADRPTPLGWSILLVGTLLVGLTSREAVRILLDRGSDRSHLLTLLVLSVMAPALGLLAPVLGLRRSVTGLEGHAPEQAAILAVVARDGATLLAGLLLGVVGLLAWFILLNVEGRRAAGEVDALLAEDVQDPVLPDRTGHEDSVIPLVRRRNG